MVQPGGPFVKEWTINLLSSPSDEGNTLHYTRIVGLVGVAISAIGLFLQSASSGAESAVPGGGGATFMDATSAATGGAAPASFDSVWGTIYNETAAAGVVLVLVFLVVVALAFVPPMGEPLGRMYGLVLTIVGVIAFVIAGIAVNTAMSDANDLQNAYAQMNAAGVLPAAFGVSISIGWVLLLVGASVAAISGILTLMANPDEEVAVATESTDDE